MFGDETMLLSGAFGAVISRFDPNVYVSLALLFGVAAQFRSMGGYGLFRYVLSRLSMSLGVVYAVALVSAVLSPFILNDVVILILTPVLARFCSEHSLDPAPLLVAEITFTNIASSLTPFGNPQNILLWLESGLAPSKFVQLTWMPLAASSVIALVMLYPVRRVAGSLVESLTPKVDWKPVAYLTFVSLTIFVSTPLGISDSIALAVAFVGGFVFNAHRLVSVAVEFDLKSMLILYVFVAAVTAGGLILSGFLHPFVTKAAAGTQPYSALFVLGVSNLIGNVPATQLLLTVGTVPHLIAPKIAVEAGLAGNIDPVGSFANLLALSIARSEKLRIKRAILLQVIVGLVTYIPAVFV